MKQGLPNWNPISRLLVCDESAMKVSMDDNIAITGREVEFFGHYVISKCEMH